ncbi:protein SENSITIVE TO UV 2 isoform X2 [Oryza glaberrima]|uniref:protein SENSITIVE TO UV 2 isoform X2 n=1 Tax=Oryza glaberrima TaxID=4538 RepID=UPI00224C1CCC|nr:protein SENSITIVE TO UV 2 isoform X2 [Oryza glaberrima]
MDGLDDEWDDDKFLAELFRAQDEAVASRNPNPTPPPPPPPPDPISYLPPPSTSSYPSSSAAAAALPLSYITPGPHVFSAAPVHFLPPRELSQHPQGFDVGLRDFSPPRELSQRPAAEVSSREIVAVSSGIAGADRFRGGGGGGARRERDAREAADRREVERLKRELNRVSKQMNDVKNECSELKKDRTRKDLEIKAKEAEIQSLRRANVGSANKYAGSMAMDIDQSVHAPANGALHTGDSCLASTRRAETLNGRNKELSSPQDGLCLNQRNQTYASEVLEESVRFESKGSKHKEIKTVGVQTDLPGNNEYLEHKKVLVDRISSNLCAVWGMPTNSLMGRSLISKILVSCSEEILTLVQSTGSLDKCEASSEASSSVRNAISQVYDIIIKTSSDTIPIQTLLEALLNLAAVGNDAVVSRALRMLHSVLQHLLNNRTMSNQRNNVSIEPCVNNTVHMERNSHKGSSTSLNTPDASSPSRSHDGLHTENTQLPFTVWTSFFTAMLQIADRHSEENIRVDALSIMIIIARTSDPKVEREKFGFTSVMEKLHQLLQKENGLLVKKHSVDLLFLLLNCPTTLKLLCNGGKDSPEQIEAIRCENDRSQEAISSIFKDLSECLSCRATSSLGIKLCRVVVTLLAYIASSGKLGYEVLLGPVTVRGANFLELIMEVLASQMEYDTALSNGEHELLKERYLLMREVLILLNRLASHANFSKPTLEVLTSSKLCATLTIDVANQLPQRSTYPLRHLGEINIQMANDLAELAQKFRTRVHSFLEEQHSTVDHSNPSALHKS